MAVTDRPTLFSPGDTEGFHPAVAEWFARRFPDGPTPPQAEGWGHIAAGRDTLIAAPTGSGKTLAGFLVCIDRLYRANACGVSVEGQCQVAYVSPLRALAVDIAENLERPLQEIAEVAAELGYPAPELTVAVRTGDTTSSERALMVRRPPNFLITTPESLYLMVTAARSRAVLRTVETIIVDEIHAAARDKRGSHLTLTLERLERAAEARPQRIGLSATQRPISLLAGMLCGMAAPDECAIVDTGHRRHLDLALELPQGELEAIASGEQMGDVLDRIADLVREHHTTLVFVNTRRLAERLAHQLGERLGDDVVSAHHGSLSKDRRYKVESRLRAGDLKALVATASLELGIDIGPVDLVCQVGSPRSIATFLQRVGRSGHSRRGTPKGRLFPLTRDELVECASLLAAVEKGSLDAIVPPEAPLDILAQQLVAEVAAATPPSRPVATADPAPAGSLPVDDLFDMVRRAYPYRALSREDFDEVLAMVSQGITTGRGRRAAYLHLDAVNGEVRARASARLAALTSGGAIPEIGDFRVVLEPDDLFVGTVNEDWATESMAGDIFLLGTHSWQIRQVGSGVVRVADAEGKPPTIPFWTGEAPARTPELSAEISALRAAVDTFVTAGDADGARAWLAEAAPGVDEASATQVVDYIAAGKAVLGVVPTGTDLVFERFFDDAEGMHLVVHSPLGGRINRALGLALRKRFCVSFDFELQAAANDDAVVLSLGPHHSFPLADVPRFLNSRTVRDVLEQAVLSPPSPMFTSRWRWNLNRALIVLRFKGGRRNPPPLQRMEADDFMAALVPQAAACQENVAGPVQIPDHPIVRQTMHDTMTEALDIDGLVALLDGIEAGRVAVHFRDTTEASAFAHEILTAKPYAFLDDAEAVDRRTNAVRLRRGLPVDLSTIGRLDPEAIARVQEEVTPDPKTADDIHDVLLSLVVTPAREVWRPLFDELAARNRVCSHLGPDGVERWWAAESAADADALVDDLFGVHPSRTSATEERRNAGSGQPVPVEQVAASVLRGHLDLSGPVTAAELADRCALPASKIAIGLAVLEQGGFVLQGRFTAPAVSPGDNPEPPGADPAAIEWCARRLLARMHSYSRTNRRKAVEPVTAVDFMRFALRWQHVAPGTQLRGHGGVRIAIEQLQGFEAAAATWEPEILRRRVAEYQPSYLDRLCHDGEVTWLRLTAAQPASDRRSSPSKATPVALAFREDLMWLLQAARLAPPTSAPARGSGNGSRATVALVEPAVPEVGATAEVVEALRDRGAQFLAELASVTRRLPTEIEEALWDGVSRGLLTADGFAAIRSLVETGRPRPRPAHSVSRLRRGAPRQNRAAGRWSLIPPVEPVDEREALAEAVADQLLQRWGVVFRDLAVYEGMPLPWRDLQWALRRFEDRGLVRGGRFVAGFSGEQYALPAAVEGLADVRRRPRSGERITVNACDPLNLTGVIIRGPRTPAVRTNTVTYVDGLPESLTADTG
ncbi:MAG TPA: DEAD/DEAH box helicase [Acidimicrobiia bacterium]|nr:DEAD/DEAH box helicase [Acidimicrobiia bacterium]